jgi:hypothetical protein
MSDKTEKDKVILSRRGVRHDRNPFITTAVTNTRTGTKRLHSATGDRMILVNEGSGEVLAGAGFYQSQEVDETKFIKLYINGVRAFKDLTSSGTKVFEVLYMRMQEAIGKDTIWLTFPSIDQAETKISAATFYRGMSELVTKEFIAETVTPGKFYLNPDFLWNGDRLAFVKEYRRSTNRAKANKSHANTIDMFEEAVMQLETTSEKENT